MRFLSTVILMFLCGGLLAGNLLKNGDFESEGGWQGAKMNRDGEVKHQGQYALKLPGAEKYYALTNTGGKFADFPEKVVVSGYVKTENIGRDGIFIGIFTYNGKWGNSVMVPAYSSAAGSKDWTYFEKTVTRAEIEKRAASMPPERQPVHWNFRINVMPGSGTAWVDGLKLAVPGSAAGETIYIRADATAAERFAADDLALYLRKATGLVFPVSSGSAEGKAPAIFIARDEQLEPQEWSLKSAAGGLFINGGDAAGAVYGVYEFLEKHLGFAWLDHNTEVIPQISAWKIPEVDDRGKPAVARREMYTALGGSPHLRLRNKENNRTPFRETNLWYGAPRASHTFASYTADWKDPALFAMDESGRRIMGRQLCPSNPEAMKLAAAKMKEFIRGDRAKGLRNTLYDFSQDDGSYGACYCPACKKATAEEGAFSGVYIRFINNIVREVNREFPEVKVRTLAYAYTLEPPQKVIADPNLLVTAANSTLFSPLLPGTPHGDNLDQWAAHAQSRGVWAYWKTFSSDEYPAMKRRQDMQREFQFCRDKGVSLYFAENEYSYLRSFYALQYFLGMKLMQDPDADTGALTAKFMNGYYGKAAPAMLKYLEYLEQRMAEVPYGGKDFLAYLDDDFFKTSNRFLDEAEQLAAGDSHALLHVRMERVPVDYQCLLLYEKLAPDSAIPGKDALIERYAANASDSIRNNLSASDHDRKKIAGELAKIKNEAKLFGYLPVPVPEQFAGREIIDYHWNNFNGWAFDGWLVEEPEAVCGMAFHVNPKHQDKNRALHSLPVEFGWHDYRKKTGQTVKLDASRIPQDEKYHWYKVGRTTILPTIYVWVHWQWRLRVYLHNKNLGIVPEEMEIWASLKITGPAYVKGSARANDIFIERLILVKD